MSRPYHGQRRKRPGRRPRYRGGGLAPRSGSYQLHGLRAVYDLLIPNVRGPARRRFLNNVSVGVALWSGAIGGVLGLAMLGPFGGLLGCWFGFTFGAEYLAKNRFYRR